MGTVKYTGPVASFHCPTSADIRSLKVHFSPKQLGEGTPSPENVREIEGWDGVEVEQSQNNLLDGQWLAEKIAASGGTIDNVAKTIVYSGSVANSVGIILDKFNYGIYTIIAKFTSTSSSSNLNMRVSYSDNSELLLGTSNAVEIGTNIYKFTTAINKQISNIKCSWVSGTTTLYFDTFGIYEGDINNYEPYRGGTTNYTFGVLGKNKFDGEWEIGAISTTTGQNSLDSNSIRTKNMISVAPGEKYTISRSDTTSFYMLPFAYKKDGSFSRYLGAKSVTPIILSMDDDEYYLKFYLYQRTAPFENCQIELGSTATTYEPYNPNHTVYGGWVDLISGEVTQEYTFLHFIKDYFVAVSTLNGATCAISATIGNADSFSIFYCNHLNSTRTYSSNEVITANSYEGWISGEKRLVFVLPQEITTLEQVKDLIDNIGGLDVAYKLATPRTYTLATTQLQTFLGFNNVWSNADYVEVEYDLHETQDILARKQFIIANQPHVEEASGAIATFNTDMAAKLKECKVGFKPVQEGEGDPSPSNVRPISGWTGLEVIRCGKNMLPAVADSVTKSGVIYAVEKDSNGSITRIHVTGTSTGNSSINTITNDLILPPGDYTITAMTNGNAQHDFNLRKKGTSIDIVQRVSPKTFSISETTAYQSAYVYCKSGNTFDFDVYPMIRLSSIIDDTFEPYTGTTIPITFPSEAGTIYGGYVDLVNGEVVQEYETVNITSDITNIRNVGYNEQYDLTNISYFLSNAFNKPEASGYVAYSQDGYCSHF